MAYFAGALYTIHGEKFFFLELSHLLATSPIYKLPSIMLFVNI